MGNRIHRLGVVPRKLQEVLYWSFASLKMNDIRVNGGLGELFYTNGTGLTHLPGNENIVDVVGDDVAVSVKIHMCNSSFSDISLLRINSGRMSVKDVWADAGDDKSPQNIGRIVCTMWNDRLKTHYDKYSDIREAVILYDKNMTKIGMFEHTIEYYDYSQLDFSFTDNSVVNAKYKGTENTAFTYGSSGGHFTTFIESPENIWTVEINKPKVLTYNDKKLACIEAGIELKNFEDFIAPIQDFKHHIDTTIKPRFEQCEFDFGV